MKFLFFSCKSLSVSFPASLIDYAKVFPKMLLAMTLLAKPVYPGIGLSNFTYYFPSWKPIFELPIIIAFYSANFCLNDSDWVIVNWFVSLGFKSDGWKLKNMYWSDEDLLVGYSNDIGSCSLKHLRRWDVDLLLCRYIFVFWINILSLYITFLGNVQGYFSKCVCIQILWFDAFNISCISWNRMIHYLEFFL